MPVDVVMPRLSDTMVEGKVLKWRKKEGEEVKKGDIIAEIETDKAAMELEAYDSGTLSKIVVPEGKSVPIGEPIALIAGPEEHPAAPPAREEKAAPAPPPPAPPPGEVFAAVAPPRVEERVKASPLARRIAEERGIDLAKVKGTGPEGRITKEDVLAFIQTVEERPKVIPRPEVTAPPEAVEMIELTKMQSTIADRMTRAKQTIPHFYVTSEIDMSAVSQMIASLKIASKDGPELKITDLLIKASALALKKYPLVNAFYSDGKLQYNKRINVGIAVALPGGLMVPVIHDCDRKSLREIASEARQLTEKVRSGHMTPADFEGGTFTLSNLGMFDVDEFAAIINPPESAILAVGTVRPTPVVRDGQIVISSRMKATISADHRVYYGAAAAEFLQEFKRLLENPLTLML